MVCVNEIYDMIYEMIYDMVDEIYYVFELNKNKKICISTI